MELKLRYLPLMMMPALFLASCGSMQDVAQVRDDVYFMPSQAPPPTASTRQAPAMEQVDDYYDPDAAAMVQPHARGYYDMAYNDPFFWNYGRFGFNRGIGMGMGMGGGMGMMGWQTGWGGPGWGMGMGWGSGWGMGMGWGMGSHMGWHNPWMMDPWGWNNPWMWNRPWGWNSPWGWNDPWAMGGWGPYMGPWGNCFSCYAPVVVGGNASNTVVMHRPSLGGAGAGNTGSGAHVQPRSVVRDPVGLNRATDRALTRDGSPVRSTRPGTLDRNAPSRNFDAGRAPVQQRPAQQVSPRPNSRTEPARPSMDRGRSMDHGRSMDRGGSFDRGGGGNFGGGGGGSRSIGGGGRPR